ncbi:hypothetical protein [Nostoc sp.]|uniref:hypothetical protein n=1 Tax=Nostoc sp. TaxID=1180 RepID=UPI002FFD0743
MWLYKRSPLAFLLAQPLVEKGSQPVRTTENQVVAKPGERVNSLRCADFATPLFYQAINFPLIDA